MSGAKRRLVWLSALPFVATASLAQSPASSAVADDRGAAVYALHCAACHDLVEARIPTRAALAQMSPERVLRALDSGAMASVAAPIPGADREAVAAFVGHGVETAVVPASAHCSATSRPIMSAPAVASWRGWSPNTANTRHQAATAAGLTATDLGRLELKWAYGFAGDILAYAAPTVVSGTVFVGSARGTVQALDGKTGCLHWTYEAEAPVRSAMAVVPNATETVLVFGDQNGWVHALDARFGTRLWKVRVETHEAARLTGAPVFHDGIVFVPVSSWEEPRSVNREYACCTFRGSVTALRAADGTVLWKSYLVDEPQRTGTNSRGTATFGPSGVSVWSSPTIDPERALLYVTTGDNYSHPATAMSDAVVALDLSTGRIVWFQQMTAGDVFNGQCSLPEADCGPDYDFGASAVLATTPAGKGIVIAGQKSGLVYGLDPDDAGRVLWQTRVGEGGTLGGVQWGLASEGGKVYATVSDIGRLPGGSGGAVGNGPLDPNKGGGLSALRIEDGERVWFVPGTPCAPGRTHCSPAQPGAVTVIDGAVFSGSLDGHVRAFSTVDGRLLWDVDTVREYATVNGVAAKGGSLDGAGPVVVDGMVYVNSGYPRFGGLPGNVLLAFGLAENAVR